MRVWPAAVLTHFSRSVRLECIKNCVGIRIRRRHNRVNVICSDVNGSEVPATLFARVGNRIFNGSASLSVELYRRMLCEGPRDSPPGVVSRDSWRPVNIVMSVDRSSFIAMEPRSVGAEGNKERKGCICIVPHGSCGNPETTIIVQAVKGYPVATAPGSDLRRQISCRFDRALSIVTSSTYSRSDPTGMPIAMRVQRTPSGFSRRAM